MPRFTRRIPAYRKHECFGQAVVTLNGRDYYLGPHGTKASRLEYDRLIGEWLQNGRTDRLDTDDRAGLLVVELIVAYLNHARSYYRKDDRLTSEYGSTIHVLRS